jgi:hypothetical protein
MSDLGWVVRIIPCLCRTDCPEDCRSRLKRGVSVSDKDVAAVRHRSVCGSYTVWLMSDITDLIGLWLARVEAA